MQSPAEYRSYAEECERMAKEAPPEHRAVLLKIAEAWRQCAFDAERKVKTAESIGSRLNRGDGSFTAD